jgi:hypothetical protein
MSSVAEKLRSARRIEIKIGDITFTGVRATPEQYSRYSNLAMTDAEVCRSHIDGIEGAKESDLIEGGAKTPWKFNREDFSEVIAEKPEWYKPLVSGVIKDAQERFLKKAENEKN